MKRITSVVLVGMLCGVAPVVCAETTTDAANLLFIKQEEKMARDVYQTLYARWGHAAFRNIAGSEQRHMDAVDGLILRYRLADTTPAESGQFTIPELQALYDELIVAGNESLEAALAVGVLIEETDIADLDQMLAATRESAIRRVLSHLRESSYNHLGAFTRAIDRLAASPGAPALAGSVKEAVASCDGTGCLAETRGLPRDGTPRRRGRR